MRSRNVVILSAVAAVLALAVFGTVAFGIYAGLSAGQRNKASVDSGVISGSAPAGVAAAGVAGDKSGSGTSAAAPAGVADTAGAIAQRPPGVFYPSTPPFGTGGAAADGISTWGVAYRQVSEAAQPDAALVRAAYQDAEKKASDLAAATGNRLGKLVAMTDFSNDQPYYKPCIFPGGPAIEKPVPGGATGSGAAAGTATTTIAPAPCQLTSSNYLVVWVYVRHALG